MSIKIIEIFVKMREMLLTHKDILLKIEKMEHLLTNHDQDIAVLFDYLKKLLNDDMQKKARIQERELASKMTKNNYDKLKSLNILQIN